MNLVMDLTSLLYLGWIDLRRTKTRVSLSTLPPDWEICDLMILNLSRWSQRVIFGPCFNSLSCFCRLKMLWLAFFWWNSFSAFQIFVGLVYLVRLVDVWNLAFRREQFCESMWLSSHKHNSRLVASWWILDWLSGTIMSSTRYWSNLTASKATVTAFEQVP